MTTAPKRHTAQPPRPPSNLSRAQLGALGERLSADYLEAEGYTIEARNWRGHSGELDLIVRRATSLVIVEVRSRTPGWLERASEAVTVSKQRQVARCADEYLRQRPREAPPYEVIRFDVIGVTLRPPWGEAQAELDHEEGAFDSPWAY